MESKEKLTEETKKRLINTYNRYGNVCIAKSHYKELKYYFGNHTKSLFAPDYEDDIDCYIIEKVGN